MNLTPPKDQDEQTTPERTDDTTEGRNEPGRSDEPALAGGFRLAGRRCGRGAAAVL
jgi:hypothetical protein